MTYQRCKRGAGPFVSVVLLTAVVGGTAGHAQQTASAGQQGSPAGQPPASALGGPDGAPLPAWKPQPKMLRYLVRATRVWKYAMQPPTGYTARQTQTPRLIAYTWHGPADRAGITPNVTLALAPTPVVNGKPYTPDRLLAGAMLSLKRGHDNWTQTSVEQGQINGLPFVRAYWTGTERQRRRKVRGVAYMAVDGLTLISLQSQDMAPDVGANARSDANTPDNAPPDATANAAQNAPDTATPDGLPTGIDRLKLAETAILTFRRYAAPRPTTPAAAVPPAPATP